MPGRFSGADGHPAVGDDFKFAVNFLDAEKAKLVPKITPPRLAQIRFWKNLQRKTFALLRGGGARFQPRDVMRYRHRRGVFVNRAMENLVSHGLSPPPVREISECAK